MGTGITTGPYSITAGQTLVLNDPAKWSIASETVQIQNNTGYNVFVQSAGAGYNIQPFTASTIPCAGGQSLIAVVSTTANVQTGFLSAIWLLPGQTKPMADGPMTVFPKQYSNVTVNKDVYSPGVYDYYLTGWNTVDTNLIVAYNNYTPLSGYPYMWLTTGISVTTPVAGFYPLLISSYPNQFLWTNVPLSTVPNLYFIFGTASAPGGSAQLATTNNITILSASAYY